MDFDRFHEGTVADFTPCPTPRREPDYISHARSAYWHEGDRVVRHADHWGAVGTCHWTWDGLRIAGPPVSGACRYDAFAVRLRLTIGGRPIPRTVPPACPGPAGWRRPLPPRRGRWRRLRRPTA